VPTSPTLRNTLQISNQKTITFVKRKTKHVGGVLENGRVKVNDSANQRTQLA
jgi:hypothetical protein